MPKKLVPVTRVDRQGEASSAEILLPEEEVHPYERPPSGRG